MPARPQAPAGDQAPPPCRKCGGQHPTWRNFAKCRMQAPVYGEGPVACVSNCTAVRTVHLFRTARDADDARREIDRKGCRAGCVRRHLVVDLRAVAEVNAE